MLDELVARGIRQDRFGEHSMTEALLQVMETEPVLAFELPGSFLDIGTPGGLDETIRAVAAEAGRCPGPGGGAVVTSGAVPDAGAPAAPVPPGVDGPAAPPDAPAPEPGEFDDPKPAPAADQHTVAAPDDAPAPLDAEVLDVLAGPAAASVPTPPGAEAEDEDDPVLAGLAAFGAEHGAAGGRPLPLDFGLVDALPWADPEPQAAEPVSAPTPAGDGPDREPELQAAPAPEPQAPGTRPSRRRRGTSPSRRRRGTRPSRRRRGTRPSRRRPTLSRRPASPGQGPSSGPPSPGRRGMSPRPRRRRSRPTVSPSRRRTRPG